VLELLARRRREAAVYVTALVGAAGAVGFLLRATSRNPSPLLVVLLALWVASPFVILMLASFLSPRSSRALLIVALVITLGTIGIYLADALWPRAAQGAFYFIVVPPASWLVVAVLTR